MRVSEIESGNRDGSHELTARVEFEDEPREVHRVWLRSPGEREPLPAPADVFVPAFLAPCLVLGEELEIEAPVSGEVLDAARERVAPVLSRWWARGATVPIRCDEVVRGVGRRRPGRTAAFFSGGVDSWYTLLRNLDRIETLVLIRGFEIDPGNEDLWKLALRHAEGSAAAFGKRLHPLATNLRDVGSRATMGRLEARGRPWRYFGVDCYFGSLLVALGTFLSDEFDRLLVAASWPWERLRPAGSHPLIEPAWSTPRLAFELDGCDAGRPEKLREIRRRSDEALSRLRVCHGRQRDRLNCGRCFKCVRTRLEMRAASAHEEIPRVFSEVPTLAEIRRMRIARDDFFWPDLLREAEALGDTELATTVRILQGERFHWPRAVALGRARLRRRLRRLSRRRHGGSAHEADRS